MNFLDAELIESDCALKALGAGFTLDLSAELKERMAPISGRRAILGIRPSCFKLAAESASGGSGINLMIKVSEYLGAQSVLVTRCGEQDLVVELESSSRFERGTTMTFTVSPEDIMLFDEKTEIRI